MSFAGRQPNKSADFVCANIPVGTRLRLMALRSNRSFGMLTPYQGYLSHIVPKAATPLRAPLDYADISAPSGVPSPAYAGARLPAFLSFHPHHSTRMARRTGLRRLSACACPRAAAPVNADRAAQPNRDQNAQQNAYRCLSPRRNTGGGLTR